MKNFYILSLAFICHSSFAQDPRLFENNWRLTNLVANGTDNFPPNNYELINIVLTFDQDTGMLSTSACDLVIGPVTFENNFTDFNLSNASVSLSLCDLMTNMPYDSLYVTFFINNGLESNDFTYTITEIGDERALTIYSMFGQQAIYSDVMMSTADQKAAVVEIYPNPASDFIDIRLSDTTFENGEIAIYNSVGQVCQTGKLNASQERIAIGSLSGGMYFIKIKTENGAVTRKFIKI